jgi:hypothetical protein
MATSLALEENHVATAPPSGLNRDAIIARYRKLRAISRAHNLAAIDCVSPSAMLQQGRRLGLVEGQTLMLDDMDDMALVFDLAIYTAPADRSRAIDRCLRGSLSEPGSDEALVLKAMSEARFSIYSVLRRHDAAGVIVKDTMRETEVWLVDEGIEASAPEGYTFASRFFTPETFAMTAGVMVPVTVSLLAALRMEEERLFRQPLRDLAEDRRFAEAIYRIALRDGAMERVALQDAPEPEAKGLISGRS